MTVVQSYRKLRKYYNQMLKANIEIDIKSVDDIEGYLKTVLHGMQRCIVLGQSLAVIQVISLIKHIKRWCY